MKYIVRTMPQRPIQKLIDNIPDLVVVTDTIHNAMDTFLRGLEAAGDEPAVHLEDDIILCDDFYNRCSQICFQHPSDVIQFFSMRRADLTIGTRYINGSTFSMNQCFYLPAGMSREIHDYYPRWDRKVEHPTGYDIMMADYFKEKKIKYLNIVPNLVDHVEGKSLINPKRSSKRQSLTFAMNKEIT